MSNPGDVPLGYDPQTKATVYQPAGDRNQSLYTAGAAGSGKSGLLHNIGHYDAVAGNALFLQDPHGDLVNALQATLPVEALVRTSVLDMTDEAWPFMLNVFAEAGTLTTEEERTEAIERIYHIFAVLWPEVTSQAYLPTLLRSAITVFLDNPGTTLYDMLAFCRDADYRARLMRNVKDPTVRDDFKYEYDKYNDKPSEQERRVQALMTRLRSLVVGRPLIRNILSQRQSINFRRAIDRREILLIKLPTVSMKQDARLIGTILMAQISAAIFSYRDTPPEERPGVTLIVDEFQNFASPDFERLVSEARKFGARLVMAHQQRDQIPDYLDKPTLNARTIVCFRVEPGDANTMGKLFPTSAGGAFEPSTRVTRELLSRTADFPREVTEV